MSKSALSPRRCTILNRSTGNLCGRPAIDGPAFPICHSHAADVYRFMRDSRHSEWIELSEAQRRADEEFRAYRASYEGRRQAALEAQSQVYYVRMDNGLVKIGYTVNVQQRMSALRVDVANILATEPGGQRLEARRHRQFADLRVGKREEFRLTDRLREHIDAVRAEHGEPWITGWDTLRAALEEWQEAEA